jgi:hypothetical protein
MESGESDETTIGATEVALMLIEHRTLCFLPVAPNTD